MCSQKRIVVIDDAINLLHHRYTSAVGHLSDGDDIKVYGYGYYEEFLEEHTENVDMFIIDHQFNGRSYDGLHIVEQCRKSHKDTPMVIVSGRINSQSTVNKYHSLGVDRILTKPFSDHELIESIMLSLGHDVKDTSSYCDVLVIDDKGYMCRQYEMLLGLDYKVATVQTYRELASLAKNINPSMVILDYNMPLEDWVGPRFAPVNSIESNFVNVLAYCKSVFPHAKFILSSGEPNIDAIFNKYHNHLSSLIRKPLGLDILDRMKELVYTG